MKICIKCQKEKDLQEFHNNCKSKDGKGSYCKICAIKISRLIGIKNKDKINQRRRELHKSSQEYRENKRKQAIKSYWRNKRTSLLSNARGSLKRRGIECNITIEDIVIPSICPIFKVPFDRGRFSPSLDRIDNSKGYTKDNIWVISRLANTMKNDGSLDELMTFCNNLPDLIKDKMIQSEHTGNCMNYRIKSLQDNKQVQGTSAIITKLALINIRKYIKENNLQDKVKLIHVVHDATYTEVIDEFAEEFSLIQSKIMEEAGKVFVKELVLTTDVTIEKYWTK